MRVLMISEDYLPSIGGISHHVYQLSTALAKRGHYVYMLTSLPRRAEVIVEESCHVNHVLVPSYTPGGRGINKARHLEFFIRGKKPLKALLEAEDVDIVHWHGLWSDNLLASISRRLSNAKLVFTNHSSMFLEIHGSWSRRTFLKYWLTRPDICISPSRELELKYSSLFARVPTVFISNGVDTGLFNTEFDAMKAKTSLGLPEGRIIITCPRRLCYKNGVQHLLKAITLLPAYAQVYFVIAGDGPMARDLMEFAKAKGMINSIRFLGAVPYEMMPAVYAASDIVVIPSLMEATSLAALEAIASGLPIIASDVGGLSDLLTGKEAGILVPPANPQALAEAIHIFVNDEGHIARMGKAAETMASSYSWDKIASLTEEVYESL